MDADSWSRLSSSAASRRLQSRYEIGGGGGDDEASGEFNCPFCGEDFDFVGLCCHIDDEHPVEAKNGVCPICASRVGTDLAGHLVVQHGSYFKVHRRRRFRKAPSGTHSIFSLLRKDLRDGNLQSLFGGSSYMAAPPTAAPDPFLSSLIYTLPMTESKDSQSENLDCEIPVNRSLDGKTVERVEPSLSDKDQKERAQRSEFVKELVLSTIFNDPL
ncbi:protein DEHYDRATION-INDUCED 19 homolog 2-like isoform X3 [Ananas comosus]|uniref:Protein DEHYDRATION-INDUCED 19 homolog 2-like isoform X3 n=1 Tax=Ananas comosus TaxID=4615 RepID=A0A6P5GCL9_ANACO|nr:protein DEHYDRATION-INDUCED 19 homolog 2-like isoform X3 [Ananas comosus]